MTVNTKEMYRGDNKTFQVTIKDSTGTAVNISGAGLKFTVKEAANDPSFKIQKTSASATEIDLTDPTNGIAEIYLVPDDTRNLKAGAYQYDVEYTDTSSKIYTVIKDTLTLLDDVTRT